MKKLTALYLPLALVFLSGNLGAQVVPTPHSHHPMVVPLSQVSLDDNATPTPVPKIIPGSPSPIPIIPSQQQPNTIPIGPNGIATPTPFPMGNETVISYPTPFPLGKPQLRAPAMNAVNPVALPVRTPNPAEDRIAKATQNSSLTLVPLRTLPSGPKVADDTPSPMPPSSIVTPTPFPL